MLWRELGGQPTFRPVGHAVLDGNGNFRFPFPAARAQTSSEWYATSGAVTSRVIEQGVYGTVSLASTATFAVSDDTETFSGRVSPSHAGEQVLLQRLVSGQWRTLKTARLDAGSAFTANFQFIKSGRQQWRATLPEDARNLESSSTSLPIKIAPATGIHKIRHIVIITQENRSFDSYFGTFPGADGFPPGVLRTGPGQRRTHRALLRSVRPQLRRATWRPRTRLPTSTVSPGRVRRPGRDRAWGARQTNPSCSPCTQGGKRRRSRPGAST